ncbi:MAG: hypothetical protein NTW29_06330 [Bacteroidetes bacterium]|nr:hypothetical protein [Bacteroidota bacterium]
MGYYIRVLGSQDPDIHIDEFIEALQEDGLTAKFAYDQREQPNQWSVLNILNNEGEALAQLERNPVVEGELAGDELDEFREIILDYKPVSAVEWLTKYFDSVKVIYAFQMLNAAFQDSNFEIISSIKNRIWNRTKGILQADHEGFSNEHGFHILWQFPDDVTGEWSCAVLNASGQWENFVMDLDDTIQRKEFQDGGIPKGARRI